MSRKLSKFEDDITSIALKLVKEKIDPQNAGMDILDLVNDEIEIEVIRERAGYEANDPWMKAFVILKRMLPNATWEQLYEVSPDELRAQMATKADQYLKQRGSTLSMAGTEPGAAPVDEPDPKTDLGKFSKELDQIARGAMRDGTLERDVIQSLQRISQELQKYEQNLAGGIGMKFKRLFSGQKSVGEAEILRIMTLSGLMEEEVSDLQTILRTHKHIMGPIIHDLRELAHWAFRGQDEDQIRYRDKLNNIADQLASFQWKLHGERERQSGQMWSDVERQPSAWGK